MKTNFFRQAFVVALCLSVVAPSFAEPTDTPNTAATSQETMAVGYEIKNAGPHGETLQVAGTAVPADQEKAFIQNLIAQQAKDAASGNPGSQLVIVQTPDEAPIAEGPNLSVRMVEPELIAKVEANFGQAAASDPAARAKAAGIYMSFICASGTALVFYFTQKVGPAMAGSVIALGLQVLMNKYPSKFWAYLSGGGKLATKLSGLNAEKNPRAAKAVFESGKIAAGLLFNLGLTTAFTLSLKYPVLTTLYPNFKSFASFVLYTASVSFATKNMWDLAISNWRSDKTSPIRERSAVLFNYSRMLYLAAVLPLLYVPSMRSNAFWALGSFAAVAVPGILYGKPYIRLVEAIVNRVDDSRFVKKVASFASSAKSIARRALPNSSAVRCENLFASSSLAN